MWQIEEGREGDGRVWRNHKLLGKGKVAQGAVTEGGNSKYSYRRFGAGRRKPHFKSSEQYFPK